MALAKVAAICNAHFSFISTSLRNCAPPSSDTVISASAASILILPPFSTKLKTGAEPLKKLAPLAAAIVSADPETAVPAAVAVADVSMSIGATAAPSPIKEPAFNASRLLELEALSLGCEREESHISIGEKAAADAASDNSRKLCNLIFRFLTNFRKKKIKKYLSTNPTKCKKKVYARRVDPLSFSL